ncbi:AMP-binding protein [Mycobacterium manitobense]|uniref:AMP-binding protein n=1 Tax=[Mycobacterium] manitobense TaxID=190147 RepID=A0A9X2YLU5_9MYCO|nr:AMP-binding protein [[Mycobacterium] manitobense]MCV7169581.1 AMP-binding protein [[Mycobacterium] manitobense]
MRLIDYLDRGALISRDGVCLIDGDHRLTYTTVVRASHRIAAGLIDIGVAPGTRVAVLGPNSATALLAVLGALRCGATWVPVNVRASASELEEQLAMVDCAVLFHDPAMAATAQRLQNSVPTIRSVISLAALPDGSGPVPDPPEDPARETILGFTGGTTGRPKAVVASARNVEAMTTALLAHVDIGCPPVYLAAAPITHAAGILCFPVMARGGTIVLQRGVDTTAILDTIERERVSFLFLPPTAIYMLLADPTVRDRDYSSLRAFVYAAAPMATDRLRQAIDVFGPCMVQLYGQSEAAMICTVLSSAEHLEALDTAPHRLQSCGRPSVVTRLAVMDDDGGLLPNGQVGELVVRSALVMEGYLGDVDPSVRAHGWHHTGDVGRIDDDGYVYLVDRKKDMIVTGGFNVFSAEVENVVLAHPAVAQCAVIGTPDPHWGEAVTAVVELIEGRAVGAEELIAHSRERLSGVKCPKRVEIWPELPRSAAGKVLKRQIRETFWAGSSRRI